MLFRLKFNVISIVSLLFLVLIGYHNFNSKHYFKKANNLLTKNDKSKDFVDIIMDFVRLTVKIEMWNYNYTYSEVNELEDLVLDTGGTPITNIIVSTWRSGSSFLGDLISAVPGTFYSFEPLMMFARHSQIRHPPNVTRAIRLLKNLIACNYRNETDVKEFLAYAKHNGEVGQFSRNQRFWNKCKMMPDVCFDDDFTERFCKLLPFQTVKLVRLRLPFLKSILDDTRLNVKLVYLVRDPRGVMHSRNHIKDFCSTENTRDCADASNLCSDMVIDYKAAANFLHKYPDKLMVLRYEDLALNLHQTTKKLLNFLRLEATPSVYEFLKSHTSKSDIQHYSTFRITKYIPYKWIRSSKFRDVKKIQEKCKTAMSLWGYRLAQNASHLAHRKFNPLIPYSVK